MAKEHISSRVDKTTKREVEQFAEERDITQSEAVRLLVDRGIDYERGRLRSDDDEGGASVWDIARWLSLAFALAGCVVGATLFYAAPALPSPLAWRLGGAVVVGLALIATVVTVGLSVAELVVQVRRHDAEIGDAVAEVARVPRRRSD